MTPATDSYIDSLVREVQRPHLPMDVHQDINAQLVAHWFSGIQKGEFLSPDELVQFQRDLLTMEQQEPGFAKSFVLEPRAFKAGRYPEGYEPEPMSRLRGRPGHRGILYVNELGLFPGAGAERWAEKPGESAHGFLRGVARQLEPIQAIVRTRVREMMPFLRRYRENDNNPVGYTWERRDGEKMAPGDWKVCDKLDHVLGNSGTACNAYERQWIHRRRSLHEWGTALLVDSLEIDHAPVEFELDGNDDIAGWYNLDGVTTKLAFEDGYEGEDRIIAVQIAPDDRQPLVGFEADELAIFQRNTRSDVHYMGYTRSEMEDFVRAGTSYLNTFTFNASSVDRNSIPRGFLTLYGRFDKRQLQVFKTEWHSLLRGASRRWQLPVLTSESKQEGGAIYTPVDTQTHEMLQTKWLVFLVSLGCAYYGMSPEQIHMESFSSRASSLSGSDTQEKLQSGHDTGMIPMMEALASFLNEHLIARLTRKFRLTWVGLYPQDEERKQERQKAVLTVNELRSIDSHEAHADDLLGNAPVNSALMQVYMLSLQQQQMEQQPGAGAGGEDYLPGSESPLPYARETDGEGDKGGANGMGRGKAAGPGIGGHGNGRGNDAARPGAAPFMKSRVTVEIRDVPTEEW